jgi:hypothetical protein
LLVFMDHDCNFYGRRRCWWNLDGGWYRITAAFRAIPNFILFHSLNNHHRRIRRHEHQLKFWKSLLRGHHAGGRHVLFIF